MYIPGISFSTFQTGQMTQRLPDIKLGDANANIQSLEDCVRAAPAPVCLGRAVSLHSSSHINIHILTHAKDTYTIQTLHIYKFIMSRTVAAKIYTPNSSSR